MIGAARIDSSTASELRVLYPDGQRSIAIGTYPTAGHMITMIEPQTLAADVSRWLGERTLP